MILAAGAISMATETFGLISRFPVTIVRDLLFISGTAENEAPKFHLGDKMKALRIYDLDPLAGALKVDLFSILAELGSSIETFVWRIFKVKSRRMEFEVIGDVAQTFEKHQREGDFLTYAELQKLASEEHQLIWAEIRGFEDAKSLSAKIIIRAIDSSFFEIETADEIAIRKLRSNFEDVKDV